MNHALKISDEFIGPPSVFVSLNFFTFYLIISCEKAQNLHFYLPQASI